MNPLLHFEDFEASCIQCFLYLHEMGFDKDVTSYILGMSK
jgi:hypothetical protein